MQRQELYIVLISELAHFVLEGNPRKMVISLHQEADGIHIAIMDDRPRTDKEMEEIEHRLHMQQRPELAAYYGTMMGHDLLGSARLEMIGWQVKGVKVERIPDGGVMINLWMGSEGFNPREFSLSS
ncbi:MAG: hypothetical protein N2067_04380 [Spirochaetaceae bacterium]|nr:hypothetical protein [Spirochaetaceae bacterium]